MDATYLRMVMHASSSALDVSLYPSLQIAVDSIVPIIELKAHRWTRRCPATEACRKMGESRARHGDRPADQQPCVVFCVSSDQQVRALRKIQRRQGLRENAVLAYSPVPPVVIPGENGI